MHCRYLAMQSGEKRTAEIDGKPYFLAADIVKAQGYSRSADAFNQHGWYTVKYPIPHTQSKNKNLEVKVIFKGDVYGLINHSEFPSEKRFESRGFDEGISALRKTGNRYISISRIKENLTRTRSIGSANY